MGKKGEKYSLFKKVVEQLMGVQLVEEHRFAPPRKWRFDFAVPQAKVAIEIEGGAYIGGRHNRATGFIKDMEKYNRATADGWSVLRFTPQMLMEKQTFEVIEETIKRAKV